MFEPAQNPEPPRLPTDNSLSLPPRPAYRTTPPDTQLLAAKEALLKSVTSDGPLPRCAYKYVADRVFKAGQTELNPVEKAAINELLSFRSELRQALPADVFNDASGEHFLGDVFSALLEKHRGNAPHFLSFYITTCPDYPYNPSSKEFVFGGAIGDGPGLVGTTLLEQTLPLGELLTKHGLPFMVQFLYADHEARDPDLQRETGLEEAEFLKRIDSSIEKMRSFAEETFRRRQIDGAVKSSRMAEILVERSGIDSIADSTAHGMSMHRDQLYSRLFAKSVAAAPGRSDFFLSRAKRDIADHRDLGNNLAALRKDGDRPTIITLSIPALANQVNSATQKYFVPVLRFKQEY